MKVALSRGRNARRNDERCAEVAFNGPGGADGKGGKAPEELIEGYSRHRTSVLCGPR